MSLRSFLNLTSSPFQNRMLESKASFAVTHEKLPIRVFSKSSTCSALVCREIMAFDKNLWKQPLSKLVDVHLHGLSRHFFMISVAQFSNILQWSPAYCKFRSNLTNFSCIKFFYVLVNGIGNSFVFEQTVKF